MSRRSFCAPVQSTAGFKKGRSFLGRMLKYSGIAGTAWLALYFADSYLNDDLDLIWDKFRTRLPKEEQKERPRIVILGGGWAALSMLRKLHTDQFRVTVISPRNYFLFTPLLPSTTVGTLTQRSIVEPIRHYCTRSDAAEADFIEAECTRIDPKTNKVYCSDTSGVTGEVKDFELEYDHLIVAVGAESATFGIPGVKEHAVFLKDVQHSIDIRDRILDSMETAHIPGQPDKEIDRLLNFVVVGGGPSGVEYAAELHDFLKRDMSRNYPDLSKRVNITLVEALPHLLTMFDASLINYTEKSFANMNINLRTNSFVTKVEPKSLTIKTKDGTIEDLPYGVLVWVTGNATRPVIRDLIESLGTESQNNRRALLIDGFHRVNGSSNIWALGDCAFNGLPATAQVAAQEGTYLGRLFNSLQDDFFKATKGEISSEEFSNIIESHNSFQYRHFGSFAYIGNHEAIAELKPAENRGSFTSAGSATHWIWRSVYFSKLLSYKNRFLVLSDWMKTFFFGRDISRA